MMGRVDGSTSDEIYIVDDDYDMREVLSEILRHAGFRTAAFTDGRSFVRLARDQKPACVLLDLCMPGPSGLDVLKDIDAKSYPAPILMLSGRDDTSRSSSRRCATAPSIISRSGSMPIPS